MTVNSLNSLTAGTITPAFGGGASALNAKDQESLRSAARQFEAMFVRTLLDTAFKDGFGGMGDSGQADQINSMWTGNLADAVTQGRGLGLQQALIRGLGGDPDSMSNAAIQAQGLNAYREQALAVQPQATASINAAGAISGPTLRGNSAVTSAETGLGSPEEFIASMRPHIEAAAAEIGVPARVLMAQAALETGWGQHLPTENGEQSHNVFGIKADRGWQGEAVTAQTKEYHQGQAESTLEPFRRYTSLAESVSDYVRFIQQQPRYAQALQHGGSGEQYIRAIADAGYATDPHYADRVMQVASSSRLDGFGPI